ncbi:hypothetical protein F7680_RS21210, partial [Escherichia coli]
MGSCAAPSAKGDDKFITTDYLQQCQIDEECFINIVQTAVAINNIGRESNGYILVGVSDTKATADRVKTLYGVTPIECNGYYINGIDHEAVIQSKNIDNYFLFIKQKIESF